jgi:LysR family transcriptional regulator, hydrogen peroxide-inducible genes activator
LNLRDLKYLVAVADTGSFSEAAKKCYIGQPTVSTQLKKLEEFLGVTLFERTTKRVMLTAVGKKIVESARLILLEADLIEKLAKGARNPYLGEFRVGAFPTLASYLFPRLTRIYAEKFPDVRQVLVEEKTDILIEQLERGNIDAAFLALPVAGKGLAATPLFDDPFYLAVSDVHPLSKRSQIRMSALKKYDLLLLDEGHCLRDQALSLCGLSGVGEKDFRATSLETLREMVKANTGITLMPKIAMRKGERHIHYVPFKDTEAYRTIGLVWRKSSASKLLIDGMIEIFRESADKILAT